MVDKIVLTQVLREWVKVYMQRSFRDFKRFMDDSDLSPSQVGTMMRLYHCERIGISDIGDKLGITVPAASQLVERLVQQGLLARAEDPQDRRFKQVALTPAGRALVESGIAARQLWLEQITSTLSDEDQELIVRAFSLLTEVAREQDSEQV